MNRPLLCALLSLGLLAADAAAQLDMPVPRASPQARVVQTVGITQVTVDFGRPAVKGRQVFGGLVPFGQVWRAGANENTVVTLDGPVQVEGRTMEAGRYGLHMIPASGQWTVVFSHNATSWGSYFYDPAEDALRVTVTPVESAHTEWLSYGFEDLAEDGASLVLRWAGLAVPLRLGVDLEATAVTALRDDYLRGLKAWDPAAYAQAASWCLSHELNLEEALGWIDRSISLAGPDFNRLWTKAGLAEALEQDEAAALRAQALGHASETQVNAMGYQYLGQGAVERALELFRSNATRHPESWNVHDSLAEALAASGDVAAAIASYEKALAMVDDPTQQQRIRGALATLGAR